jgi:uncharacterized membrane protein (DUF2068 family)
MTKSSAAGLKTIAIFEALKGVIVLLAAAGVISLVHKDAQAFVDEIVRQFHLNPASRYPRIFLDVIASLSNFRLWLLAAGASLYATLRFTEAYGLWHERAWGEWVGVISGSLYLPIEIYELMLGVTPIRLILLATNLLIVAFLGRTLYRNRQELARRAPLSNYG